MAPTKTTRIENTHQNTLDLGWFNLKDGSRLKEPPSEADEAKGLKGFHFFLGSQADKGKSMVNPDTGKDTPAAQPFLDVPDRVIATCKADPRFMAMLKEGRGGRPAQLRAGTFNSSL